MKKIKKSIEINASKEKVWAVLTEEKYTNEWYSEFHEGSKADTDWKQGSKAVFKDNDENGIVGFIAVNDTYKEITIEYTGMLLKGVEDFESDMAKNFKGSRESYRLSEENGVTKLDVESDMIDEMFDMMSGLWDNALAKVKKLSEQI